MLPSRVDPGLDNILVRQPVNREGWTPSGKQLLANEGVLVFLLVLAVIVEAFADQGLACGSSGTCTFGKEAAPCEQYVSIFA